MTTKKSSANSFGFTYRTGLISSATAPAVINMGAFLILAVLVPFITLFSKSNQYDDAGNLIGQIQGAKQFTYLFIGPSDVLTTLLIVSSVVFAVFTAIFSFRFITGKKTVNVFYSLGITREKLFMGKYLSGLTLLAISVLVPLLLIFIVNIAACGFSVELLRAFLYLAISFLAIVTTAFSLTSAVFACVGTTFETGIFTAILLFFSNIFFFSLQTLMDKFVYGSPYGTNFQYAGADYTNQVESLSAHFSFLSPILFNRADLSLWAAMDAGKETNPTLMLGGDSTLSGSPSFWMPLVWLVAGVGIGVLGMLLFRRRKAEICGFIGTNKVLNTVGTFAFAFFMFCVFVNSLNLGKVVCVVIGTVAFIIVYVVLELLLLRDLKKFARGLYRLPAELAVAGVFVALFATGLFGFSERMPELSDIKSAAVSFVGVNDEYAFPSESGWYGSGTPNFATIGGLVDGFESEKDLQQILSLHENIGARKDKEKSGKTVQFVYTLKNGKKLLRNFTDIGLSDYEGLLKLEETDLYRERLKTVFLGEILPVTATAPQQQKMLSGVQNALRNPESLLSASSRYLDVNVDLNLSASERQQLIRALYNDLSKRTVEEKYLPTKTPEAVLSFREAEMGAGADIEVQTYQSSEEEANGETYVIDGGLLDSGSMFNLSTYDKRVTIAVTSDMTETLSVLRTLGVLAPLSKVPAYTSAQIISVKEYIEKNDWRFYEGRARYFIGSYVNIAAQMGENPNFARELQLSDTVITDQKQIASLLESAYTMYEMTDNEGYFVAFYTKDMAGSTVCYIPGGELSSDISALL